MIRSEMSQELDEARQYAAQANYSKAIKSLWAVYNYHARTDFNEAQGLLEIASDIRTVGVGSVQRDAEALVGYASTAVANLDPERLTLAAEALARPQRQGIPVSTSNDVPGFDVVEYVGEVFGNVVRSRGALPSSGAGLKSIVGGEIKTMTNLLDATRRIAIERMVSDAVRMKADAVIATRVDVTSMGGSHSGPDWTEVCAYGTAVRLRQHEEHL